MTVKFNKDDKVLPNNENVSKNNLLYGTEMLKDKEEKIKKFNDSELTEEQLDNSKKPQILNS